MTLKTLAAAALASFLAAGAAHAAPSLAYAGGGVSGGGFTQPLGGAFTEAKFFKKKFGHRGFRRGHVGRFGHRGFRGSRFGHRGFGHGHYGKGVVVKKGFASGPFFFGKGVVVK